MNMTDVIEKLIDTAKIASPERAGDYIEGDLLYCGKCHTPKQTVIEIFGAFRTVPCLCQCETEKRDAEEERRKAEQEQMRINALRINGIQDRTIRECTFDMANSTPMLVKARRYTDKWADMLNDNIGLLMWGNTGNGKTYTAACIANELISRGVPVLMTSFAKILSAVTGMYTDERIAYLNSLSDFKLLIIDDLGAERQSEFALEQVYSVVDHRYKSKLPMIVTTNISIDELRNPKNMDYQRIYDRVLEMCVPLHFAGDSLRKIEAKKKLERAVQLFAD